VRARVSGRRGERFRERGEIHIHWFFLVAERARARETYLHAFRAVIIVDWEIDTRYCIVNYGTRHCFGGIRVMLLASS